MCEETRPLCHIRGFHKFLEQCLKRTVLNYTLKALTKPGDNYGSVMQAVDVKVAGINDSSEAENMVLVAKTAVTNPYLVDIFQPALTFVKEAHFYSDIIPAIEEFECASNVPENEKIDAFIKCFGSRISLNPDAKIADADSVVLLENIKLQNYDNENRHDGFNTEVTLAVLKSLAKFHALGIAMRRLQPMLFTTRISPHLDAVNLVLDDNDTQMVDSVCNELPLIENLNLEMRIKIEKQLKTCYKFTRDTVRAKDTAFTTVVHRDLWINNVMIKKDEAAVKVKIYDFQLYFYQTFVCDLILFLFTSVCCNDLATNFKTFISCYCSEFVKTLKTVNCPLDDYTFEKMWKEIQTNAKIEMLHVLYMSRIALADGSSIPASIDDISAETFYKNEPPSKIVLKRWKFIIDMFTENGFI